jgi:hypothetical protein
LEVGRFLIRRHIQHILLWRERRDEGSLQGFSNDFNWVIRERLFPDPTKDVDGAHAEGGEGSRYKSSRAHVTRSSTSPKKEGAVPRSEGSTGRSAGSNDDTKCTPDDGAREPCNGECWSICHRGGSAKRAADGAGDGSRPRARKPGILSGMSSVPHAKYSHAFP